jgi:hypothetical protein
MEMIDTNDAGLKRLQRVLDAAKAYVEVVNNPPLAPPTRRRTPSAAPSTRWRKPLPMRSRQTGTNSAGSAIPTPTRKRRARGHDRTGHAGATVGT